MKVIVCFDSVRVIVPCGDGELPVRKLIIEAIHRYRKATGKAGSHWVDVHKLKTISGGGILDPDDQLNDVCDDREQLIADFDEEGRPLHHHNGGDGASASSTGTTSPDIFQGEEGEGGGSDQKDSDGQGQGPGPPTPTPSGKILPNSPTFPLLPHEQKNAKNDIIVTKRDFTVVPTSTLRVRRGSEPALNTLGDDAIQKPLIPINNGIIALHRRESGRESDEPESDSSEDEKSGKNSFEKKKKALIARFSRDAFRTSLSNRPEMFVWMEARERQEEKFRQEEQFKQEDKFKQVMEERKGPIGASTTDTAIPVSSSTTAITTTSATKQQDTASPGCVIITLENDGGPLGIHVVPASDDNGRDMGLMIQSVEPGGRIHKDGRLNQGDRIVEINGADLASATFTRAQEIFRCAMKTDEIRLKVIKVKPKPKPAARQPPAIMPKPRGHVPAKPSPLTLPQKTMENSTPPTSPDKINSTTPSKKEPCPSTSASNGESTLKNFFISTPPKSGSSNVNGATVPVTSTPIKKSQPIKPGPPLRASSPTKKTPPAVPVRHPTTSLTSQMKERPISTVTNTRKIGKKIQIDLKKGPLGLGFSVTSRDNMTGGDIPIYIKNILPKGAAIQDGHLKPGDRLLEVNEVSMSGKTQAEVVTMLRNTPQGFVVSLLVSRQEEVDERFTVPREMASSDQVAPHPDKVMIQKNPDIGDMFEEDLNWRNRVSEGDDNDHLQPMEHSEEDLRQMGERLPEVIFLEIPLNDTGSAGLGVSVKGKTVTTETGPKDLGIFVKGVISGGAAYKDGRLLLNDQLLEVNGINLEGLSNVAAMENLRRAMTSEGPLRGHIQLTVARKLGAPSPFPMYENAMDTSGQGELIMKHYRTRSDLSQASEHVDSPHHSRQSSTSKLSDSEILFFGDKTPLIASPEKLGSGHSLVSSSTLRNESYLKATNDSLNNSSAFLETVPSSGAFRSVERSRSKLASMPTVNASQGDEIIIEEDDPDTHSFKSQLKQRPHSTIGFFGMEDENYSEDGQRNSVGEESDLSPSSPVKSFLREGFGRQSMSEKRKGHLDPRSSEVYQRAKASKDQKETKAMLPARRARSFHVSGSERRQMREGAISAGAALGRSGSMESLTTSPTTPDPVPTTSATNMGMGMLHDPHFSQNRMPAAIESSQTNLRRTSSVEDLSQPEPRLEPVHKEPEEPQVPLWRMTRLGRVRTCNESFRAAVDRSYDPVDSGVPMDTLEEESMESGSFSLGQRSSGRSSFSSDNTGQDYNSLKKKKVKDKKPGGGLLGFLRLGKGRKSTEDIGHSQGRSRSRSEERPSRMLISQDPEAADRIRTYSQQHADDSHLHEQYRRIQEQQQRQLQHQQQLKQQLQHEQQQQPLKQQQQLQQQQLQQQQLQQQQLQQQQQLHQHQQRLASSSSHQSDLSSSSHSYMHGSGSRTESPFRPYQQDQKAQMPVVRSRQGGMGPTRQRGDGGGADGGHLAGAAASRAERIQQLRMQHQQQHRARQGIYPMEQNEEIYEQNLQDDERRYTLAAEVHHNPRPQKPIHYNLQAEIHHDPHAADPHRYDLRADEPHHYHNPRMVPEGYSDPHPSSDMHLRNLRADIHVDPRLVEVHRSPRGEVVHMHQADVHHDPRLMESHDPRLLEGHDPRLMEGHQEHRPEMHRQNLRAEIHSAPRREMGAHDPRSHLGVYDRGGGDAGSSYSHQYSRPTSQQSEAYRNSPYPSVSSMGSDSAGHPHAHNYPPHSSHTLSGYDPHLLHHHHHHHHPQPHAHPPDMYESQYESHYGPHEGRPTKRDSFVERQRQYFDEAAARGFQEPPHRSGYGGAPRVQRFPDPGSAKV